MNVPAEPAHPQLDELLHETFDELDAFPVYADWLEERGEPRAALIRLQLRSRQGLAQAKERVLPNGTRMSFFSDPTHREAEELIERSWVRWFGSISPRDMHLWWDCGFATQARFQSMPPAVESCGEVLSLPALRFVRGFEVGSGGGTATLEGLDRAPSLRHLTWSTRITGTLAPLRQRVLPRLETLRLELLTAPSPEDLDGLGSARCPALLEVRVECLPDDEPTLLAAAPLATWFSGLKSFELRVTNAQTVPAIVALRDALQPLGAGLTFSGPAELIAPNRGRLRAALPQVTLRPLPRQRPPDDVYQQGTPRASAAPVRAPKNFRELPPWKSVGGKGDKAVLVGSGVTFAEAGEETEFSLCASCASADTRCIFLSWSSVYCHFETTWFTGCEYECRECGKFTNWEHHVVSD